MALAARSNQPPPSNPPAAAVERDKRKLNPGTFPPRRPIKQRENVHVWEENLKNKNRKRLTERWLLKLSWRGLGY